MFSIYLNTISKKLIFLVNRYKSVIFIIITTTILFLGYKFNTWKVVPDNYFRGYEEFSESLIVGRMAKSRQDGIFSYSGLLGRITKEPPKGKNFREYQYTIYFNDIHDR